MSEQQKPQTDQAKNFTDKPKSSAGAKVTVACKLPHGIVIRPYIWAPSHEPVMGGGVRETKIAQMTGEAIIINGVGRRLGEDPRCRVVAGYAITEGVDKDAWDQWLADNIASEMVKNKMVIAYEQADRTIAAAKENKDRRSGLEPLSQDKDPRMPRPTNKNVGSLTPEDDQQKRRTA